MKLRNKWTGEIIDDGYVRETHDFQFDGQKHVLAVFKGNGHRPPERVSGAYTSLAKLNEEWEDYEEPKEYWCINSHGEVLSCIKGISENSRQSIGNYFEAKEEAEKAVEKLKAWKRLKDKGFRFDMWKNDNEKYLGDFVIYAHTKDLSDIVNDLDLLFCTEEKNE